MNSRPAAEVVCEVLQERQRQDAKWGEQNHGDSLWACILGEEFGEACQAALKGNGVELRKELIQVAAVAVSWVEALDRRGGVVQRYAAAGEIDRLSTEVERLHAELKKARAEGGAS